MTSTLLPPERGDVFVAAQKQYRKPASLLGRLLFKMGLRDPDIHLTLAFRIITFVSPIAVQFTDAEGEELFCVYRSEFYDWQAESYQVADRGRPLLGPLMDDLIGIRELPFNLEEILNAHK